MRFQNLSVEGEQKTLTLFARVLLFRKNSENAVLKHKPAPLDRVFYE